MLRMSDIGSKCSNIDYIILQLFSIKLCTITANVRHSQHALFSPFYALVFQAFFCLLIKVSSPMLKNSSFASLPRLFLLCCQCLLLLTYSWKKPWMWNRLLENSSSFAAGKLDLVWQTNRIDSNPTKQQIKFASTSLFFHIKEKKQGK